MHGPHQGARALHAAAQNSVAGGRGPALRNWFPGQMNDSVRPGQGIGREFRTQGNSPDDVAGAPKMFGDGASDKPRGSGNGDVHSGNVYRVARLVQWN